VVKEQTGTLPGLQTNLELQFEFLKAKVDTLNTVLFVPPIMSHDSIELNVTLDMSTSSNGSAESSGTTNLRRR
jgi:hypothetical protein